MIFKIAEGQSLPSNPQDPEIMSIRKEDSGLNLASQATRTVVTSSMITTLIDTLL